MSIFASIQKPTLLLNTTIAKNNLHSMAEKTRRQRIRLRPHFKTHQSATIGEWFRAEGVTAITVSSIDMAYYFSMAGWQDITIAFPVNLRQIDDINTLAGQIKLALLVESPEAVQFLAKHLTSKIDLWIKVDVGNFRTGLAWDKPEPIAQLAAQIRSTPNLALRGLLTHAGQTYHAASPAQACQIYQQTVGYMNDLRHDLIEAGITPLEITVGDTPGCSLCDDLGEVDEIRPGNFIFYDAEQCHVGSCKFEDIAVAVACPVVARHPERNEVVIYGGAIHLSKDYYEADGIKIYGTLALPDGDGWGQPLAGGYVARLSQEHGIIHLQLEDLDRLKVGDLVCVIPAHSCLTVTALKEYLTLSGSRVSTLNS
jgi:D-serine deaminase-like pyridoxal phosphate-dependent protein